ncbi:MAG TPA: HAMP domain-containing sensor histidine kinase [Longimicrobiales bacterium]
MTDHRQPLQVSQGTPGMRTRRGLRRLLNRLGGLLRHEINNPLQAILSEAEMLAERGARDEMDIQAAAQAIAAAARRIAAVVAEFEQRAARELGEELTHAPPAPAAGELVRVLAAELNLIARHAESAFQGADAARLRPRLRRVARLAHAWLATGARLRPSYAAPPSAPEEPTPAAPAHQGGGAAVRALAFRLQRLETEHRRLQEHLEKRERFWRFATHELRNAANAFVSWAYVLRRSEIGNAPWYAPLVRAAEAMLRRTEEALDLQGTTRTDFELRIDNVNLVEAAREALEMIRPTADHHNLTLALAAPPGGEPVWAQADPDRLQQILQNLLRNAIGATPPGGSICITVRQDAQAAMIEVEDTGRGIPSDAAASLFQVERPAAAHRPGHGLGLPLSRHLAELMGGSLELQPAAGSAGARFVLRLPRASP